MNDSKNAQERTLEKAKKSMADADVILVFAGAGMSVDSSLPTYRDKEGFWNDYPLYRELKKDFVNMVSGHTFLSDPSFAWGFYGHRYNLYNNAIPHEGYDKLLHLLNKKQDYFVVTTNVDGLFLKSGLDKNHLHEAHGSIHKLQCSNTCKRIAWDIYDMDFNIDYSTMAALEPLPICPSCGSVSRPNIFISGDNDESYIWEESQDSASLFRAWRRKNKDKKIVILEIGVGVDGLKKHITQHSNEFNDSTLIRINPELYFSYSEDIFCLSLSAKKGILKII